MTSTEARDTINGLRQEVRDLGEKIKDREAQDVFVVGLICFLLALVGNSVALLFLFEHLGKYAALAHPVALALIACAAMFLTDIMGKKPLLLILIIAIVLVAAGTAMYVRSEFKPEVTKPEITQPKETKK